jgi:hypothetical protein
VTACFKDGSPIEGGTWRFPVVIDCGVFKETETYEAGDGVTRDGSFWIAQDDAPKGRPGTEKSGWRLAVKRGDVGKTGPPGQIGPRGPQGERGPERW